jgi:transcriptional regulator
MYVPARYSAPEDALIAELVRNHPFATLITPVDGEMKISHVPLLLEERSGAWVLIGHLARANDHWKALGQGITTAIFHGPHAYITPTWYERCDVPTWNYVVAHLSGPVRLLEQERDSVAALELLSARMEGKAGWQFEIPADLSKPGVLMKSIIGFEVEVQARVGKFKLSQNKSSTDFDRVMAGLDGRADPQSRGVLAWMQRFAAKISR